jgi:2-polyprenyl-3-methyl-5-hydroxy-6-metoxy-1,4-benzoquinol methylase
MNNLALHDMSVRILPPDKEAELRAALYAIYPPPAPEAALEIEIQERPFWFRTRYVPWIESVMPLLGKSVLEVGTGTGTSMVPVAECGATVCGVDLNRAGLDVAHLRARLHGVGNLVATYALNGEEIGEAFTRQRFDLVVYFASLEHMTHAERMKSLKAAWELVHPGGYLSVCDAPNRLWFHDIHTAGQNFYHWLPDELAVAYAPRTPRPEFNSAVMDTVGLARWGRGVSFHDFEVALGIDVREMTVAGEWEYRRGQSPSWAEAYRATPNGRYHDFLCSVSPDIPAAFLEEEIALMIKKPR